jgi:hypothetical protein
MIMGIIVCVRNPKGQFIVTGMVNLMLFFLIVLIVIQLAIRESSWCRQRNRLTPIIMVPAVTNDKKADYDYFKNVEAFIFNTLEGKRPRASVDLLGIIIVGLLNIGASCTVLGKGSLELVKRLKLDNFEK